jgi:hypothetical protein
MAVNESKKRDPRCWKKWTDSGSIKTGKDLPKVSVGDQIRMSQEKALSNWRLTKLRSSEYANALNMTAKEIKNLESLGSHVVVILNSNKEISIISKNTCGADYDDTWYQLLQVRTRNSRLNFLTFGGGTSRIDVVEDDSHFMILDAIKKGSTRIQTGSIWP